MAKKSAPKKTSKRAAKGVKAAADSPKPKVYIPQLAQMVSDLIDELDEIEAREGSTAKTAVALARLHDLLPLISKCQQSMTRP